VVAFRDTFLLIGVKISLLPYARASWPATQVWEGCPITMSPADLHGTTSSVPPAIGSLVLSPPTYGNDSSERMVPWAQYT